MPVNSKNPNEFRFRSERTCAPDHAADENDRHQLAAKSDRRCFDARRFREESADLARKHDLLILSDEIYSEIFYADRPASMLDVPDILDRVFFVNGFSKIYAMTGWRLGYGVVPEDIFPAIDLFVNNSVSSTATFTQRAALEAFTPETTKQRREDGCRIPEAARCFCRRAEQHSGYSMSEAAGRLLSFPERQRSRASERGIRQSPAERSRRRGLPGTAFGEYGEGYMRFSFANSLSQYRSCAGTNSKVC